MGVVFSAKDRHFIARFGRERAEEMVLDYTAHRNTPFIFDTYQLSALLGVKRRELFALTCDIGGCYHRLEIPKRSGGRRVLWAPDETLKAVQRRIADHILSCYPVSSYACGYRKGKGIVDNARPHVGKRYLLKLDIADFFDSISFQKVYSVVFNTTYYPPDIGVMLTELCCLREHLPQGAVTSPALSNIIMRFFDERMGTWCCERGIDYTRYCDDITFSGDEPLYHVFVKAKALLEAMGFELQEKKTRFMRRGSAQHVTGLVVNEGISLPREQRRALRQEIYYALRFGLADGAARHGFEDGKDYRRHLLGRLSYALCIHPDNAGFLEQKKQLEKIK